MISLLHKLQYDKRIPLWRWTLQLVWEDDDAVSLNTPSHRKACLYLLKTNE